MEPVPLRSADERLDRLHGVGEPRRRLVAREPDALELELGPALIDLGGLEGRRLDAEAPLHGDDVAERLRLLGRREEHVADLVEADGPPSSSSAFSNIAAPRTASLIPTSFE